VLTAFFILFNYKILSRFVALIYIVMNEKNPKPILISQTMSHYLVPSTTLSPHQKFEPPTKAHVATKPGIFHGI